MRKILLKLICAMAANLSLASCEFDNYDPIYNNNFNSSGGAGGGGGDYANFLREHSSGGGSSHGHCDCSSKPGCGCKADHPKECHCNK